MNATIDITITVHTKLSRVFPSFSADDYFPISKKLSKPASAEIGVSHCCSIDTAWCEISVIFPDLYFLINELSSDFNG